MPLVAWGSFLVESDLQKVPPGQLIELPLPFLYAIGHFLHFTVCPHFAGTLDALN